MPTVDEDLEQAWLKLTRDAAGTHPGKGPWVPRERVGGWSCRFPADESIDSHASVAERVELANKPIVSTYSCPDPTVIDAAT